MAILHIINKIKKSNNLLLKTITEKDSILLIEDALFMLQSDIEFIKKLAKKYNLYAIKQDAKARAVTIENLEVNIRFIDYNYFVTLTEKHQKILSWH